MESGLPGATGLPGGAALTPGEQILVGDKFMYSTVAFYLHTDLVLTSRRLYAMRPSTLLGLIRVGTNRSNFPIENIAGVNAGTHFSVGGLLVGVLAVAVGLAALSIPDAQILGVILVALGVAAIVGSPKQAVEVMNSGGGTIKFPVSAFERSKTVQFANRVSEAVARTARGAIPAPSEPFRAGDTAEDALRNLQRLQQQGLISEAEYSAKRAEILNRL